MTSVTLSLILEKISSRDKDFRYMATSDLANELAKPNFRLDASEAQVSKVVLDQLDDSSGDISSLALKCLGLLANKVTSDRLSIIATTLIDRMCTSKKDQQRDVACLGLKAVITEVEPERAPPLVAACVPPLVSGLRSDLLDVATNCMDALAEITARHGYAVPDPDALRKALMPELDENKPGIRKRAIQCLAVLAAFLPPASLEDLCNEIFTRLEATGRSKSQRQSYIQALTSLYRSVGFKLGGQLSRATPLVLAQLQSSGEGDDEVMELCLAALEAFVQRSPGDARPFMGDIMAAALRYMRYDPNYAADEDEDMDEGQSSGDEDYEDEEPYSDDEDTSWKVRRGAAKLAAALVGQYTDVLLDVYRQLGPALVARFKEREEAVRPDVYQAYIDLVASMGAAAHRGDTAADQALSSDVPSVMRAAARQLKTSSPKTKTYVLRALQQLVRAVPAEVTARLGDVLPGVNSALEDKSTAASSLKIEALHFINAALSSSPPSAFQPLAPSIAPAIFAAAGERYYAVAADALRACEQLVRVLRPDPPAPLAPAMQPLVHPLFEAATARVTAQDQPQEVKDAAIGCMAAAVAVLGDIPEENTSQVGSLAEDFAAMPNNSSKGRARKRAKGAAGQALPSPAAPGPQSGQVTQILSFLVERLGNEITRLTAVRALGTIARSPLPLDLTPLLPQTLSELTSFLRKTNRQLRLASLHALTALVSRDGPRIDPGELEGPVGEAAGLIGDSDLAVAASALRLLEVVVQEQTRAAGIVSEKALDAAISLVMSPLLQGAVLSALQSLLVVLAASGTPSASFDALLDKLGAAATAATAGPSAAQYAAKCVAALCRNAGQASVESTVRGLLGQLESADADDGRKRFCLVCIGELGRASDLKAFPALPATLTSALSSEAVAEAASHALGGVAAGNLPAFLPLVLEQVSTQAANPKLQYQLLRALNEVITTTAAASGTEAAAHGMSQDQVRQVLQLLLASVEREEECRAVVAECLGHLALLAPDDTLGALRQQLGADAPEARAVAVTALKHASIDRAHPIDAELTALLPEVLARIDDPEVGVRRAAVQLLSAAAHNKPSLVTGSLQATLPLLFAQTKPNPALVRIVNLGPFKHEIDDGLELRKAAYECLGVLMAKCYDKMEPAALIETLSVGLKDHYDVKMRCLALLSNLVALAPGAVTASLDRLVEPLTATLNAKVKTDAVKQEIDRNEDMLRACLRAIDALARLPGAVTVAAFKGMMDNVVNQGQMKERYAAVVQERKGAEGKKGVWGGGAEPMDMS